MCEAKPGLRCAADTRDAAASAEATYHDRFPDGPEVGALPSAAASFEPAEPSLRTQPGDSLVFAGDDIGGSAAMFDQVEVVTTDDGEVYATASVPFDFTTVIDDYVDDPDDALNRQAGEIEDFLKSEYGAELSQGDPEWSATNILFHTDVDPAKDTLPDVVARLEQGEGALRLHNEMNGAYGHQSFDARLREHLDTRNAEVADFVRAYETAALWSSTGTDDDGDDIPLDQKYDASDIADTDRERIREDARDFTRTNRALIQEAGEKARAAGRSYTFEQAGHDYWLSRNGHGAGFWDRGLGETGDALHDAAKHMGSVDLYQGDDGHLYLT